MRSIIYTYAIILQVMPVYLFDCYWNYDVNMAVTQQPMNPYRSCLTYCAQYYSKAPQRRYYNITSQMCEPKRKCLSFSHYYDYPTNKCYTDETLKLQVQSQIPQDYYSYESWVHESAEMICLNGIKEIRGVAVCICEMFWKNSGKVDMNGIPFKCDQVTDNPAGIFFDELEYDKQDNIIKYGRYSADEIQVILYSLRQLENRQILEYTYKNYESILYAINETVQKQAIIRHQQILIVIIVSIMTILIFWASYIQYRRLRIPITKNQLKQKIANIVNGNAIIQSQN